MNWGEKLKLAWENKDQIADGFYHTYISHKPEIDAEATRRKTICESNICGYYDKDGKPENAMVVGKPSCSICKCNIDMKTHCTYCWCALRDIGQSELWSEIMTKQQDDEINTIQYQKQFEKPNNQ